MVLDEIDKMSKNWNGDPAAALLEVLDPNQNHEFRDHYIEIPFDLSQVMFIATANDESKIPEALKDRMEIINISRYTDDEKLNIAKNYLIKDAITNFGFNKPEVIEKYKDYNLQDKIENKKLELSDDVLKKIISDYTPEAGVRNLKRKIDDLFNKQVRALVDNKPIIEFTPNNLEQYLPKIRRTRAGII